MNSIIYEQTLADLQNIHRETYVGDLLQKW